MGGGSNSKTEKLPNREAFQSFALKKSFHHTKYKFRSKELASVNSIKPFFYYMCPTHTQNSHSLTHMRLIQSQTQTHSCTQGRFFGLHVGSGSCWLWFSLHCGSVPEPSVSQFQGAGLLAKAHVDTLLTVEPFVRGAIPVLFSHSGRN